MNLTAPAAVAAFEAAFLDMLREGPDVAILNWTVG